MASEKLIIIGGVAAGMSAAAKAKRTNPDLEIVVYEQSGYISYGACGFPYYIKGDIADIDDLIMRTPEQMAKQGVTALVHHEVVEINPAKKTVRVVNHQTGESFTDHWDKLILAAGASVNPPAIPGFHLPGVFTLRTVEDAMAIRQWLVEEKPKRGVIVGAGYIGLEMAEALRAHHVDVTIVDMANQIMPSLDAEMAELIQAEMDAHDVKVCLQQPVQSFVGPAQVEDVVRQVTAHVQQRDKPSGEATPIRERLRVREVVTQDHVLPADMVIFGIGSRPNVSMAEAAGIRLGTTGAIAVDVEQRTSVPDIWAAGAVAEVFHLPLQTHTYIPLATTANKQGRIAGTNAAGGLARFGGVVGSAVVKTFDLTVASTGLTQKYADYAGIESDAVVIKASSRAHYMQGSQPIHVKLVYEKKSQRVLGAQMIGKDGVAKRIDVVAAALKAAWTLRDIANLDLAYAPPFAPVWDPLLVAANVAISKESKR